MGMPGRARACRVETRPSSGGPIDVAAADLRRPLVDWLGCASEPGDDGSSGSTGTPWSAWLTAPDGSAGGAWVITQLEAGVGFGSILDSVLEFDPTLGAELTLGNLLDARVFNEHGEVHIWRGVDGRPRAHGRADARGESAATFDEGWSMWGTRCRKGQHDGWTEITEDRGTTLRVPLAIGDERAELPLRLGVRHYLGEDDLGMPRILEIRFIGLATQAGYPEFLAVRASSIGRQTG